MFHHEVSWKWVIILTGLIQFYSEYLFHRNTIISPLYMQYYWSHFFLESNWLWIWIQHMTHAHWKGLINLKKFAGFSDNASFRLHFLSLYVGRVFVKWVSMKCWVFVKSGWYQNWRKKYSVAYLKLKIFSSHLC